MIRPYRLDDGGRIAVQIVGVVIGVIVAICGTLYWRFRRNGWV
jgi:hypothetical protein